MQRNITEDFETMYRYKILNFKNNIHEHGQYLLFEQ